MTELLLVEDVILRLNCSFIKLVPSLAQSLIIESTQEVFSSLSKEIYLLGNLADHCAVVAFLTLA